MAAAAAAAITAVSRQISSGIVDYVADDRRSVDDRDSNIHPFLEATCAVGFLFRKRLSVCLSVGLPRRTLRWMFEAAYRSRENPRWFSAPLRPSAAPPASDRPSASVRPWATDECQMRNLHAVRVIIHFKDGGVNDDMRSGAEREERSTKKRRERKRGREEVRVVIST